MDFIFRVHNDIFNGAGSFKDDLYTGMSKDSSKVLNETRNIGNRCEGVFS